MAKLCTIHLAVLSLLVASLFGLTKCSNIINKGDEISEQKQTPTEDHKIARKDDKISEQELAPVNDNNNIESRESKISEQKSAQIEDSKYPTLCIKSVICNNAQMTKNEIHFGDCWCCIFKGKCYSSKFICTVLCLVTTRQAMNGTSSVP